MGTKKSSNFAVAIGASAGGLSAIKELIAELPDRLDAPIVIGVHGSERSTLVDILQSVSALKIKEAEDNEVLKKGWIYILPGAKHGFFRNGRIHISDVIRDSGFRPSIDALFMTLAAEYGKDAIAVVLSGSMKDGMRGAQVIFDTGGQTIVQDPKDAAHVSMPTSVILNDHPETVLSATKLGQWLGSLIGNEA